MTQPQIMVLSHGHHLLPFAYRLVREQCEVEVAVVHARPRYAEAWAGKFRSFIPPRKGGLDQELIDQVIGLAQEREAFVLTDSLKWTQSFREAGYERIYGSLAPPPQQVPQSILALGAWFDGEGFSGGHLLVRDLGLWPGGFGPAVTSGATLVPYRVAEHTLTESPLQDSLKGVGFRGLVSQDVVLTRGENGDPQYQATGRWSAGWAPFHTHSFVSDQPSLLQVLEGHVPQFPKAFTHCVAVSVPPWPLQCNLQAQGGPILGPGGEPLPGEILGATFFHDMKVEDGVPEVVGLDGLVGVVRGSANQLELARSRALRMADAFQLPEKQFRVDSGAQAQQLLVTMEDAGVLG